MGRVASLWATQTARARWASSVQSFTLQRRGMGKSRPQVWSNEAWRVSGGCRSRTTKGSQKETVSWNTWATTSKHLQPSKHLLPSVTSFISFRGSSPSGWLERFFFSAFILKAPAANTCLHCHWLTPKYGRVRFPNINGPQENNSFCQAHTMGRKAFNYQAFLLISYIALGLILQSHLAFQTSMQGLWKTHFLLWPHKGEKSTSKSVKLPGSWCR